MNADRIDTIFELTAGLPNPARAALLRALADLIATYPSSESPWDSELAKFSEPKTATSASAADKTENSPTDDAKRLRKRAESLDPKPEPAKKGTP
ncbi:MAG: hypothetical protein AB7I30_00870 [Isosphaeraceae bacterium]